MLTAHIALAMSLSRTFANLQSSAGVNCGADRQKPEKRQSHRWEEDSSQMRGREKRPGTTFPSLDEDASTPNCESVAAAGSNQQQLQIDQRNALILLRCEVDLAFNRLTPYVTHCTTSIIHH